MISKKHRFHGLGSLRFVYNKGQTVRAQHFALRYAFNKRRDSYRVAVVVSKKVNKSAVVRNRIRRRLYEVVRLNDEPIKQPLDLVLTVYSEAVLEMPHEELSSQVAELINKAIEATAHQA